MRLAAGETTPELKRAAVAIALVKADDSPGGTALLLTLRAAVMKDKAVRYSKEASMAKLYASETANWVADIKVPVFISGAWQDEQVGSGFASMLRALLRGP